MMKTSPDLSHRFMTTEWVYLQNDGRRSFQAVLRRPALASKMGSFPWKCVEYKEENGFVIANFTLAATGRNVDCVSGSRELSGLTVSRPGDVRIHIEPRQSSGGPRGRPRQWYPVLQQFSYGATKCGWYCRHR